MFKMPFALVFCVCFICFTVTTHANYINGKLALKVAETFVARLVDETKNEIPCVATKLTPTSLVADSNCLNDASSKGFMPYYAAFDLQNPSRKFMKTHYRLSKIWANESDGYTHLETADDMKESPLMITDNAVNTDVRAGIAATMFSLADDNIIHSRDVKLSSVNNTALSSNGCCDFGLENTNEEMLAGGPVLSFVSDPLKGGDSSMTEAVLVGITTSKVNEFVRLTSSSFQKAKQPKIYRRSSFSHSGIGRSSKIFTKGRSKSLSSLSPKPTKFTSTSVPNGHYESVSFGTEVPLPQKTTQETGPFKHLKAKLKLFSKKIHSSAGVGKANTGKLDISNARRYDALRAAMTPPPVYKQGEEHIYESIDGLQHQRDSVDTKNDPIYEEISFSHEPIRKVVNGAEHIHNVFPAEPAHIREVHTVIGVQDSPKETSVLHNVSAVTSMLHNATKAAYQLFSQKPVSDMASKVRNATNATYKLVSEKVGRLNDLLRVMSRSHGGSNSGKTSYSEDHI